MNFYCANTLHTLTLYLYHSLNMIIISIQKILK